MSFKFASKSGRIGLDWLLGPRCPLGCGERLYPRDVERHYYIDHAADVKP